MHPCDCVASACNTDTTPIQPHRNSNTHRTKNNTINVVIQQNSRKLPMMDILMSETCWTHKKWNKIASGIKLVFYSSTITMMHGPINIRSSPIMFMGLISRHSFIHFAPHPSFPILSCRIFLLTTVVSLLYLFFQSYLTILFPVIYLSTSIFFTGYHLLSLHPLYLHLYFALLLQSIVTSRSLSTFSFLHRSPFNHCSSTALPWTLSFIHVFLF